jgi:hypothetical protein
LVLWVDRPDFAFKTSTHNVAHDDAANRSDFIRRTNYRDGFRVKDVFQVSNAHAQLPCSLRVIIENDGTIARRSTPLP